jgi:hypothetical protein
VAFEQLLRPYPQYSGLQVTSENLGRSEQHMVSVTIQKRFNGGMQLLAAYTRSKMMEETSRLNPSDTVLERRLANEDRPNRLVLSGVYALPFGEGRRIGASSPFWVRKIISGWSTSGIYTYQSGSVVAWGNVIYLGGDLQWDARNVNRAFDTTRFNANAAQQLDRNLRTLPSDFGGFRNDAINTVNLALLKTTALTRGVTTQFRAEAFNLFDRVQFATPVLAPTNTNFGRITSQVNAPRSVQFAIRMMW